MKSLNPGGLAAKEKVILRREGECDARELPHFDLRDGFMGFVDYVD
jgi:hypothetical protein